MVRVNINRVETRPCRHDMLDGKKQATTIDPNAEAFSHRDKTFVDLESLDSETSNPLITAVYYSFANHMPLEISPDVIFNTILQGISTHVSKNPEHFRDIFVTHVGKKGLVAINNDLVKGDWNNNWEPCIEDLGEQLFEDMQGGAAKSVLKTTFSTTTPAEAAAHKAAFMDTVKHYYDYTVVTMCGIPYIDVLGTKADWIELAQKISPLLEQLGLSCWNAELQNILAHFGRAFDGEFDWKHWNGIYNYHGPLGSGGVSKVSGWIGKLFLYVKSGANPLLSENMPDVPKRRQPLAQFKECPWKDEALWSSHSSNMIEPPSKKERYANAIKIADFPAGITSTPFLWDCLGAHHQMKLIAGLVGITVSSSGCLKPEVGWIVAGSGPSPGAPEQPSNDKQTLLSVFKKTFHL